MSWEWVRDRGLTGAVRDGVPRALGGVPEDPARGANMTLTTPLCAESRSRDWARATSAGRSQQKSVFLLSIVWAEAWRFSESVPGST